MNGATISAVTQSARIKQSTGERMARIRKIIHIDMDMFYAAVEMRDNPKLRGKPVVVGGKPNSRGVVSTANYEARKYGIHSAMACAEAYKRCPQCLFVPPDFKKYKEVSQCIRDIFFSYTDLVEPMSLDEAYLDVTNNNVNESSATIMAIQIKKDILSQTGLTASAGVAPNKFVAKIASDFNKPNGLCVVRPEAVLAFIEKLPVIKVPGIGKVTNKRLIQMGITTVSELADKSSEFLTEHFGKFGSYLYDIARGQDEREVEPYRERQSYGRENTFHQDILDIDKVLDYLYTCSEMVFSEFSRTGLKAKTVTLKIKYHDFKSITRRTTCERHVESAEQVFEIAKSLLRKTEVGKNTYTPGRDFTLRIEKKIRIANKYTFPFEGIHNDGYYR